MIDNSIDVKTLYEASEDGYADWCSYGPMINAFGNCVVRVDEDAYSGDTLVLYDNDGTIGYLKFGWGSCSGCDALQGCSTYEELQELCDYLQNQIIWFGDVTAALDWFEQHDWEGDYIDRGLMMKFFTKALGYLYRRKYYGRREEV